MAFPLFLIFLVSILFSKSTANLTLDYYKNSCPDFADIVRDTVTNKQLSVPTTAGAALRMLFHDCMVEGCDASILISSNSFNQAERDADINVSLPGDGYDVMIRAKTALELACPKTVSCADILAQATRDLVTIVGGPYYDVRLGRKDGLVSQASRVEGNIPRANMTLDQTIKIFAAKGFTIQEMVALTGAHTVGFAHCREFSNRIFSYSQKTPADPDLNPSYAERLKKLCGNSSMSDVVAAFNDVLTPGKFDNMYYKNLLRGLGLLASDNALRRDPRTKPIVEAYAANQDAFFKDFGQAMEKLNGIGVKSGNMGEIRNRCDQFNDIQT